MLLITYDDIPLSKILYKSLTRVLNPGVLLSKLKQIISKKKTRTALLMLGEDIVQIETIENDTRGNNNG